MTPDGHDAPHYVHRHVVTFDETNLVGNVYFAHYLHWQGHCRELFLAERAAGVVDALQVGTLALVTVSCGVDFYAECLALDVVDVCMSLQAIRGNRVEMDFRYLRDGVLVARGRQTVACMKRVDGGLRPGDVPAELSRALMAYR